MWYKNYIGILLWIVVCLSVSGSIHAQNISITAFKEDLLDQDARANFPRRDHNNQLYALIKIETALNCDGFQTIDFGAPGFGIIDCTKGIWVYAPAGATRISMLHNPAGSVVNYNLPASLRAGTVYVMTLEGGRIITRIEENLNAGYLIIEGNIENAYIKIENENPELMLNNRWSKTLSPGRYNYEITRAGSETERGLFTIQQEENTVLRVQMISSSPGELKVSSTPEQDAIVIIDGIRQTKKTPASFPLNAGDYRVVVSKELYKEAQQEVKITGGQTTEITLPLTPNFANIHIRPAENEKITIYGEMKTAGSWQGKLEAGLHTLVVEKESHRPYKSSIDVKAGNDRTLEIPALEPIYGKLNITSAGNVNAKVYVDGVERSAITPCVVQNVLTGKRQIRLVPDTEDYLPYETVVEIGEGKITNVEAILAQSDKKSPPPVAPNLTLPSGENGRKLPDEKPETGTVYPKKTFLEANFSWSPTLQAYGLTAGQLKRIGWYLSFLSNFKFTGMDAERVSDGNGYISGLLPAYSGNTSTTRISATAGVIGKLSPTFALYAGGGYGYKALFWETIDGEWIKNDYYSHSGLDIEGGVLLDLKGFTLSTGLISTNFKRMELKVGIGFAF